MASADELVVGRQYAASWSDCCAAGSFTAATLVEKKYDDEETDFLMALVFDNGVTLGDPLWKVEFTAATTTTPGAS